MIVTLTDIENALERLSGVAIRTPLLRSAVLNERSKAKVLIKPENLQHIGAFKFRGAYNRLAQLDEAQKKSRGCGVFIWQPCPGCGLCRQIA
jgi:threonine dehydratase